MSPRMLPLQIHVYDALKPGWAWMLPPHAAAGLSVQISLPDAPKLVFQAKVLFSGFFRLVRDTRANPPNLRTGLVMVDSLRWLVEKGSTPRTGFPAACCPPPAAF